MITLTGKESKLELQQICDVNEIKYSKLDSKDILVEKINLFNQLLSTVGESKLIPIVITDEPKNIIEKLENEIMKTFQLITGSQYCNIKGHNKRTNFFIEKKYKDEKYSIVEWEQIFKSEGLI